MSPMTPRADLALGPLPSFLSWLPRGIDRTLPSKVQGLTETLISAALGEGCPGVGTQGRNGLRTASNIQTVCSGNLSERVLGKQALAWVWVQSLFLCLHLSWAACSSASFDIR